MLWCCILNQSGQLWIISNIFTCLNVFFKALNFRFWPVSQSFDFTNVYILMYERGFHFILNMIFRQSDRETIITVFIMLTLNLLNFLNKIIHLPFLELSIIIFTDIKLKTWSLSASSVEPSRTAKKWQRLITFGSSRIKIKVTLKCTKASNCMVCSAE